MSGFMGSETVVGSHKLFIGSRLNIKYVSEPSDMDSNLLIRNFPGGMGGWRIYFRWKPRQPLGLRLKLCQSERCTGWLTVAWRTNIIWLLVFINYLTNGKGIRSLATSCAIWRPIHFRWHSYFLCERSRYCVLAAFGRIFERALRGQKGVEIWFYPSNM